MKKRNNLIDTLIVVFVACFVGMISGGAAIFTMNDKGMLTPEYTSSLDEISDIYQKIIKEYYQNVDEDKLVEGAISGMLATLDSNSSFLNDTASSNFNNRMKGEYYGLGLETLQLEDVGVLVVTVIEDSPADKAGILEGDIITKVNNESMHNKKSTYFSNIISTIKDDIELTISRNEEEVKKTVSAEKITIYSVTSNTFYRNYKQVGYIKISLFAANTASQFTSRLKELESNGIDSLIIDVRDNAGGYLSNAATILQLFMKKDTIIYKTETKSSTLDRKDSTDDYRDYPVAILVNGSSASASEVLAACFKENYGAELVGTTTYGKGTVQETVNVLDDSMAKITTKKWLTPNGIWINGIGIEPTVPININENYLRNPVVENDNQLETALNAIIYK